MKALVWFILILFSPFVLLGILVRCAIMPAYGVIAGFQLADDTLGDFYRNNRRASARASTGQKETT